MVFAPALAWLQSTRIATTIGHSNLLTGFISAIHLLGLTLIAGAALVSSLRLLGVVFPERPVPDITGAARRGIALGLAVSVGSGLLLFAPRAATVFDNGFFQLKMLLLTAAVVFHWTLYRNVTGRADAGPFLLRLTGTLGLTLWFGVALAGCAFILLE